MRTSDIESKRILTVLVFTFVLTMIMMAPLTVLPSESAIVWDPVEEISDDKGSEYQRYPAIAAQGGKAYAVWADNDGKDYNTVFREHDGIAWQAEEEISANDMNIDQWNPDVAVDSGVLHTVWHDSVNGDWDIMYKKRSGGVWGAIEEINEDITIETQMYPKVAASGGYVYVVWQDGRDGDWDIYFRFHNGVSWSAISQVNVDSGSEAQTYPRITAGGGNAYVVWVDEGGGDKDILMRVFDGNSWGSEMEVSEDFTGEEQDEPDLAYDSGVVHFVWQEFETTDRDIFYRNYNGVTFSTVTEISIDSSQEFQKVPAVAAQFGVVHTVWVDKGDGDWDIMYRQFNGTVWLSPQQISVDIGTEEQYSPDIATDNGVVHVIWEDLRDGDNDIRYRRGNETTEDIYPPEIKGVLLNGENTLWIPEGTLNVTLRATVDDSAKGGHVIEGANFTWGERMWFTSENMIPNDALDSPSEDFYYDLDTSSLGIGTYEIFVYGWDELQNRNIIGVKAILIVVPSINLEEGWNLVSFPQILSDTALVNVLASIEGDFDAVQYYNTSDTNDPWKHYHNSKPPNLNDFSDLDNKMGFWVHVTAPGGTTLIINGTLPFTSQNVSLYPGWNHVGYPSPTKRDRTAGLNNLIFDSDVDSIWTHNATTKLWKEVGEFDYLEYGKGYWVHAKVQCDWMVNI